MQSLCPLNTCIALPIQAAYATPDQRSSTEKDHTFPGTPSSLESWLEAFERQVPDHQIRVQVHVYPDDPAATGKVQLDRGKMNSSLKAATETLGSRIPMRKKGFYDATFLLHREGNRLECQTRIVPRVLTGPGVRLLKRLDLAEDQRKAGNQFHQYWIHELPWLRRSGIQLLEIRCNLNPLFWR